jgi:RNA polymerase sigma-70 factor (ECF subfamily)
MGAETRKYAEAEDRSLGIGPAATHPETWVAEHGDVLYRYAMMRLRDPVAAEEAVQETFLAALGARARFSCLSTERTWLVGILKHKIVDLVRKHSREKPPAGDDFQDWIENDTFTDGGHWRSRPPTWRLDPASCQERSEFREVLAECLAELPPRQREAFKLRELDDLGCGEICRAMGITESNLWVTLHRARLRLRRSLKARWGEASLRRGEAGVSHEAKHRERLIGPSDRLLQHR